MSQKDCTVFGYAGELSTQLPVENSHFFFPSGRNRVKFTIAAAEINCASSFQLPVKILSRDRRGKSICGSHRVVPPRACR